MWDFCTITHPKARKDYPCDAWGWLSNCDCQEFSTLTFSERKSIVKAKRNSFKIKRGEIMYKCSGRFDGEFTIFRAIPELDAICKKYDIYQY